jgi:hypothetical protein
MMLAPKVERAALAWREPHLTGRLRCPRWPIIAHSDEALAFKPRVMTTMREEQVGPSRASCLREGTSRSHNGVPTSGS